MSLLRTELLCAESICKIIHQKTILSHVTFQIFEGEAFVVLGASGAGKSCLAQILSGILHKDDGRIFLHGQQVQFHSPEDAQDAGIHIVQKHSKIVDALSISENIFLFREKHILIPRQQNSVITRNLEKLVGLRRNPDTLACELSEPEKSLVELASALSANPKLLIVDEATLGYSDFTKQKLRHIINMLKQRNSSVLYATDNIRDALSIADRILVLRDGVAAGILDRNSQAFNERTLITIMAGKDSIRFPAHHAIDCRPILETRKLSSSLISNISFTVNQGEALGIIGPAGGNKTILLEVLYGYVKKTSGGIFLDGAQVQIRHPADALRNKIGYFTSDRSHSSLVPELTVLENISLSAMKKIGQLGFLKPRIEKHYAKTRLETMHLPSSCLHIPVGKLSSSIQQKIQLIQVLIHRPQILLMYEPMNDIDLETKKFFRNFIKNLSKEGVAIVIASYNMEEALNLCDRFIIMYDGQIKGELSKKEARQSSIIALMQK